MNLYKLNKLRSLRYLYGGLMDFRLLTLMYNDIMLNHPGWDPRNIHKASEESGLKGLLLEDYIINELGAGDLF